MCNICSPHLGKMPHDIQLSVECTGLPDKDLNNKLIIKLLVHLVILHIISVTLLTPEGLISYLI